jgi:hypothetical protein
MHTPDEQHLALLLDCPDARFLVIVFLRHEYRFFDVSEHEVAMRIVCLKALVSIPPLALLPMLRKRTCNRPLSSRSPRSLTMTTSSMHRRTRSSGSLVSSFSSMVKAIVGLLENWLNSGHCFGGVNFGSCDRLGGSGELAAGLERVER